MDKPRLINGLENLPQAVRHCVLSIGNFDGVHVGHRGIIQCCRELASGSTAFGGCGVSWSPGEAQPGIPKAVLPNTVPVVALTFEPPPEFFFQPPASHQRIDTFDLKCRLMLDAGVDFVVAARTDRNLLGQTEQDFVQNIIVGAFEPRHVVEGPDFRFGLARRGDTRMLTDFGAEQGFAVHVVPPVSLRLRGRQQRISSTLIRQLVIEGDVEQAGRCLGRPFTLSSVVVAGEGIGRLLDFPTANIECGEQVCPGDGVYAGEARIAGQRFPAAISVGNKLTFGPAGKRYIEAFLIGAGGDYYGLPFELSFIRRLREQRKFDSPQALKEQIAKDVQSVREICG
jgi:riboflavin kinase/FMN adenylyltransferase